jgi:hypothetical protein
MLVPDTASAVVEWQTTQTPSLATLAAFPELAPLLDEPQPFNSAVREIALKNMILSFLILIVFSPCF